MNNKGFAITGILYTIMIMFTMIIFAILTGLNTKMKIMQKSIESFKNDYATNSNNLISKTDEATEEGSFNEVERMNHTNMAIYTGKYDFTYIEGNHIKHCTKYLSKNMNFKNSTIKFIKNNDTCSAHINELKLETVYAFK